MVLGRSSEATSPAEVSSCPQSWAFTGPIGVQVALLLVLRGPRKREVSLVVGRDSRGQPGWGAGRLSCSSQDPWGS